MGRNQANSKKQTAHLLSQMGGCIAIRHHGGITPEAETLSRVACFRSALLRLVVRRGRTLLVLRHELVELFLVLGVTQAVEEILELDLLFLEPLQGFHAVLVKGPVAARGLTEAEAAETATLHAAAHPVHLVLHPLHLVLPAVSVTPTTHFSAP